jgi:hypothetical protein
MPWEIVVALPNINTGNTIEASYVALVSPQESRVQAICREKPALLGFLNSFADDFNRRKVPSVLLFNSDAPETYGRSVSSFRDLVALSTIPYHRAIAISYDRASWDPVFANSFDFCPWMVRDDGKYMYSFTPAISAMDEPKGFRGRVSSEVSHLSLGKVDEPILEALLQRWERRFSTASPQWEDVALFRSLNMAFEAARTPFITGGSLFDIGRLVALWVSAFEILAHPGEDQQVSLGHILGKLRSTGDEGISSSHAREDRKLRQRIYQDLYNARNDYLHGNPVDDTMLVKGSWNLTHFAAPLYRMMLSTFLGLQTTVVASPNLRGSEEEVGKRIAEYIHRNGYLRVIQEALRKYPPAMPAS